MACGNGTAGIFAPEVFNLLGIEVIPLHCDLDASFPNYNPNPEDLKMLKDLGKHVLAHKADIGFAFDGDGDRIICIDEKGNSIDGDKILALFAKHYIYKKSKKRTIPPPKLRLGDGASLGQELTYPGW